MTYDDDPLLSVSEAAKYLGVTPNGVRTCMHAAGLEFEWAFRMIQGSPREVMVVRQSILDAFRARGFLTPRRGRRANGDKRVNLKKEIK